MRPSTRLGLPETQLGIIPGWGSHRLPRRVGIPTALDAILTGRLFDARKAQKLGIIDRTTKPEYLLRIASDVAMARIPCPRKTRGWKGLLVDRNPLAKWIIGRTARKAVMSKTRGKYPAPLEAIRLVLGSTTASRGSWARREADAVAKLGVTPVCKALVSIFFANEGAKALGKSEDGRKLPPIERAAVVGAGIMGGGIASVLAQKSVDVRLADLSPAALAKAQAEHEKELSTKVKRRRMTSAQRDAALDHFQTVPGTVGMGRRDFAIEAVAEVLEVKRKVLGALASTMPDDAILATNTSSLSVDAIANSLPNPERVIGMHFFNPVPKMPLVEIIRGSRTSDDVVTRTAALALRLGKTPVICKDVRGFLVNRLFGPYLDEAVRLFLGGVEPARLDRVMLDFGMPMGPLALLDEVGIDIAHHTATSLHEGYGERMTPAPGLDSFVESQRLGKKTGKGFYVHKTGQKPELAEDLGEFQKGSGLAALSDAELVDRMVLAMFNEACLELGEGVVEDPTSIDLATVFGMGFAPFYGGLLRYGEQRGLDSIVQRLRELEKASDIQGRNPGRFAPAPSLREAAASGRFVRAGKG
ncbi:MAG: 3-hydroxyacyl-CoA dehydrogenase NAD-binding domain-containing protein [Planctomycetota bacterium]